MKKRYWISSLIVAFLIATIAASAYSKRSSGFSGKSFKSGGSSYRFSSNTPKSKPPVTIKPKIQASTRPVTTTTTTTRPVTTTTTTTRQVNSTTRPVTTTTRPVNVIQQRQQIATSRDAYQKQQQQFKSRTAPIKNTNVGSKNTTIIINRPVAYRNNTNYNRSTYYERRGNTYQNWHAPSYSYNSYSSFGAWDGMAMWFMLSQAQTNAMYANMFYHQSNDSGFKEWRKEADLLAKDNKELRAQLNQLDQQNKLARNSGTVIDPNFLPTGVDADILLSADTLKSMVPSLRLCTGNPAQTYQRVGRVIANNTESVNVQLVPTSGSIQNLTNLDNNKCDAALVQRDSYIAHVTQSQSTALDYTRLVAPYSEVVHLVCTVKSDVQNLSDLYNSNKTIAIGEIGSGHSVTWFNVVNNNEKLLNVRTLPVSGNEAITLLKNGGADCVINVSGVNNNFMKALNLISSTTTPMELVEWDDNTILDTLDPSMNKVYFSHTLDHWYPNLQLDNFFGSFTNSTEVILVPADLIISNTWLQKNSNYASPLGSELQRMSGKMQQASH